MAERSKSSKETPGNKPKMIHFSRDDANVVSIEKRARDDAPASVKPVSENPFRNLQKPSEQQQPAPKKPDGDGKK